MARAGLDKNRKFLRLAQELNAAAGGMGEVMALGILETLWDRCDPQLGSTVDDIELILRWPGEPGYLSRALIDSGFVVWRDDVRRYVARRWERPHLRPGLRRLIAERDGMICGLCGSPIADVKDLHIDHIRPMVHGGASIPENLQAAHAECNMSKGARY